jgi:hypothetical protein
MAGTMPSRCHREGPPRTTVGRLLAVLAFVGLAGMAACGDPDARADAAAAGAVPPDTAIDDGVAHARVDWRERVVELDAPGWEVEFCPGDGPFLCVDHHGEHVGAVELFQAPLDSYEALSAALARGTPEQDALEAAAAGHQAAIAADRRTGEPDYELLVEPVRRVTVAGRPGVRSSSAGVLRGDTLERSIQYRVIVDGTFYLIGANAYGRGEGTSPEGDFNIRKLEAFQPVLDRIAAGSRLR